MRALFVCLVLLLLVLPVAAQDNSLSLYLVCWDRPNGHPSGNMIIGLRYAGPASSWGGAGYQWSTDGLPYGILEAGDYPTAITASVDGAFPVSSIQVWVDEPYIYAEIEFSVDTPAPDCGAVDAAQYGPDGGWIIITKPATCDPCTWEIQDEHGTWNDTGITTPAQDEGAGRFTRLVLGRDNPVTDPARYRVR